MTAVDFQNQQPTGPASSTPQGASTESAAPDDRAINLEGFYNARDLGGLPLSGGGTTKRGGYARSADLRFVPEPSLEQLRDAGYRTVLDLRNEFETRAVPRSPEEAEANAYRVPPTPEPPMPDGVFSVRVPLDNARDLDFWARMRAEGRLGSPRFFRPVINEQPDRVVEVLRSIAHAPQGGVLYHCAIGRDRTGLVSFALLTLAEVEPQAIVDDYLRSVSELRPFFERLEFPDPSERINKSLERHGFTIEDALWEQLDGFDPWASLVDAGLTEAELVALRSRLVD